MKTMWHIVCVGPGPQDHPRRTVDYGPRHPDKKRVLEIAAWLRGTGLYEDVQVVANDASEPITSSTGDG